jgi:queuine tRNA-ribosyltransferase
MAGEMLGPILLSIHNITYYQRLLAGARIAIADGQFEAFRRIKLERLGGMGNGDEAADQEA